MRIFDTTTMDPKGETEKLWVYNGLDCCLTVEIFNVISQGLDNMTRGTYEFSKALQAPILEMNMRGVLIDEVKRHELADAYRKELVVLEDHLNRIVCEGLGWFKFNWRSNPDLIRLFYQQMNIAPIKKRNTKGEMVPTVNREALEKLRNYFYAQPVINHILGMRDLGKRLGVLETEIDPDGRIRTSYNIAGTTTGRLSSSMSDFGTGTNLQNIEQRLRRIFIADPGLKFANIDLKSGDSFGVGMILAERFGDSRYLDACESGDIHTSVAMLAWKDQKWSADMKENKRIAETIMGYRDLSLRDLSKKLGHGTNYYGKPPTMARHTKLPIGVIQDFQHRYFASFPLELWHLDVAAKLLTQGYLVTLLGRKRWFMGRRNDDATLREAIAYEPQSLTSDTINGGMLEVWRQNQCQLLLQVHDSILVQYPEELENDILPRILKAVERPIQLSNGRVVTIPAEAKVGWNWANKSPDNPEGLMELKGQKDVRKRGPLSTILDRKF